MSDNWFTYALGLILLVVGIAVAEEICDLRSRVAELEKPQHQEININIPEDWLRR